MAGCEGCFARGGDTGDLHVADLDRPANLPLLGGDCGCGFRRSPVKRQHAPAEDIVNGAIEGITEAGRAGGPAPEAPGRNGFRRL